MSEKAPSPKDTDVRFDAGDLAAIGKSRVLRPSLGDFKGETRFETNAFGRTETVKTVPVREALEAMRPFYRAETERSQGFDAKQAKETVRGPDGKPLRLLASQAEGVARLRGLRPFIRRGRPRTEARYYLDCGHYIECANAPDGQVECPWGCGVSGKVERQSEAFIHE